MRGRFLLAALCAVAAAGCVQYSPQPLTPEQGAADLEGRTLGGGTWDRSRLMAAALKMHPDMEVARAKLEVAKAAVITAGASPNPIIGYSATNTSRLLGGVPPWTNGFILDVPIETAGKRGHRIAQAQSLLNAAALDLSSAERKVQAKVRSSLFTLFAARQREELAAQQQSGQEEAVKLFDARIDVGEVSRAETLQAHLQLNQTRLQNREAQKVAAEARVTLAGALGVSVHALEQVRLSFAGLDTLPHPHEPQLRRAAMLQRPDVLSSLAAYAAAEAALRLEMARQWPDLHLGPGYSYDQGQDKWTIGFTLTLPVFDQNRGPIAEALAKRREAAATFIAQQTKALGELELALASYRGALTKLETAGQLLAAQERQQRSAGDLFKAGETDRLTLVSAQVELQAARLSRLDALIEAQQALGALEDASGLLLTP